MAIFNNCHYKCIFPQSLKIKCSKCRRQKKTEHTHMREVDATSPFRVTWLSQLHVLHVSPLNKKRLVLKFVINVLRLEKATENLLLKLLPLDQLNPCSSFLITLLFLLLSVFNPIENKTNIAQTSFTGTTERYYRRN